LSRDIDDFLKLKIINGQETFRETYLFIQKLIESKIINSEIHFDDLCKNLRKAMKNDVSQSLKIRTLICLEKNGLRFKNQPAAHGLSECNGRYAVVLRSYKNIIWHEAAHLFGADDHYIENSRYKMKEKCSAHESCSMQFDPGDKQCYFCSTAVEEIRNNMFKEAKPFFTHDL
jgi:hypothetical protein